MKGITLSSDNYWLVRRTADNKFSPVMGFASDDLSPTIRDRDPRFDTPSEALNAVISDYAEYGHSIDPECFLSDDEWSQLTAKREAVTADIMLELGWWQQDAVSGDVTAARVASIGEEAWSDAPALSTMRIAVDEQRAVNADLRERLAQAQAHITNVSAAKKQLEDVVAELREQNTALTEQLTAAG